MNFSINKYKWVTIPRFIIDRILRIPRTWCHSPEWLKFFEQPPIILCSPDTRLNLHTDVKIFKAKFLASILGKYNFIGGGTFFEENQDRYSRLFFPLFI